MAEGWGSLLLLHPQHDSLLRITRLFGTAISLRYIPIPVSYSTICQIAPRFHLLQSFTRWLPSLRKYGGQS